MAADYTVEHQDGAGHGRFFIDLGEGFEAEMTYRRIGSDVMVIDHTYTPPEFRGRNMAALLMNRAIEQARIASLKIVPQCSYAAAQFRRHPEWGDLLAQ